jgi:hypothetical protein
MLQKRFFWCKKQRRIEEDEASGIGVADAQRGQSEGAHGYPLRWGAVGVLGLVPPGFPLLVCDWEAMELV